jgi:hypothetical protein
MEAISSWDDRNTSLKNVEKRGKPVHLKPDSFSYYDSHRDSEVLRSGFDSQAREVYLSGIQLFLFYWSPIAIGILERKNYVGSVQ